MKKFLLISFKTFLSLTIVFGLTSQVFAVGIPTATSTSQIDAGHTNDTNPYAQLRPGSVNPRPAPPAASTLPAYNSVESYLVNVVNFILDFLGLIVICMLVLGGYQYMMAMGDSGKIKKSKSIMSAAIIGFFLVVLSFAIVTTIITATRPGVNECAGAPNGICLSSAGSTLNFGVGSSIARVLGSIF